MQKVQDSSERTARIAGRHFRLSSAMVVDAVRGEAPEPLREHVVVVDGRRYPPKQVLARVTGLDRADFTTNQARAVLRRLGFTTARSGESARAAPDSAGNGLTDAEQALASALRRHRGEWVALAGDEVVTAASTPEQVLAWLTRHGVRADSLFRVPLDPAVDLGGFPG